MTCAYANILSLDWKAHMPFYITLVLAILVFFKFLKTAPVLTKKAARKFRTRVENFKRKNRFENFRVEMSDYFFRGTSDSS